MRSPRARKRSDSGFTLIEMMVVMSLILILLSIAVPAYNQSILRARESVLRQNLFTLNSVISQYTLDKQKEPQSLDDVKQAGYLRDIPKDPMTRADDWVPEQDEQGTSFTVDGQDSGGIIAVHSASTAIGSDGTTYDTWR